MNLRKPQNTYFPLFYYVVIETLGMEVMLQKVVPKTNALAAKSWRQQPFTPEIPHPSVTTTMPQSIHHRTNPSGEGRRTILARPPPAWSPVGQELEGNPWRRGPRLSPDHWTGVKTAYSAHRAMGFKGPLGFELARTPGPEIRGESLMDGFTPRARPRALLKLWQTLYNIQLTVFKSASASHRSLYRST